jgi:hypothetical protein
MPLVDQHSADRELGRVACMNTHRVHYTLGSLHAEHLAVFLTLPHNV